MKTLKVHFCGKVFVDTVVAICHRTLMLTSPVKVSVLCGDRSDVTIFLQLVMSDYVILVLDQL